MRLALLELVWISTPTVGSLSQTIFYAQRNSATSFTTPLQVAATSNLTNCFSAFAVPSTGNTDIGRCECNLRAETKAEQRSAICYWNFRNRSSIRQLQAIPD